MEWDRDILKREHFGKGQGGDFGKGQGRDREGILGKERDRDFGKGQRFLGKDRGRDFGKGQEKGTEGGMHRREFWEGIGRGFWGRTGDRKGILGKESGTK